MKNNRRGEISEFRARLTKNVRPNIRRGYFIKKGDRAQDVLRPLLPQRAVDSGAPVTGTDRRVAAGAGS